MHRVPPLPFTHQHLVSRLRQPLQTRNLGGLARQHLIHGPAAGAAQRAHAAPLRANHHGLADLQGQGGHPWQRPKG